MYSMIVWCFIVIITSRYFTIAMSAANIFEHLYKLIIQSLSAHFYLSISFHRLFRRASKLSVVDPGFDLRGRVRCQRVLAIFLLKLCLQLIATEASEETI